jgi:MerR family transcriptional regulator, heat shock protein HspR
MTGEGLNVLKDKDAPLYTMGIAAKLVGTTAQTLRLYEKHGLILPARERRNRLYTENNITWLRCIRELIHTKKISIEGIKKLLEYAPCWEIKGCSDEKRLSCSAFTDKAKPCWQTTRCRMEHDCATCVVYLKNGKKEAKK